jgi:hypothetical protein
MNPDERDQLLLRYLDDNLTVAEGVELNQLLESDANTRRSPREMVTQAVSLADLAREQDLAARRLTPVTVRSRSWSKMVLAVAAAAVVLVSTTTIWWSRGKAEAVTLAQVAGAVSWTAEGWSASCGIWSATACRRNCCKAGSPAMMRRRSSNTTPTTSTRAARTGARW